MFVLQSLNQNNGEQVHSMTQLNKKQISHMKHNHHASFKMYLQRYSEPDKERQ